MWCFTSQIKYVVDDLHFSSIYPFNDFDNDCRSEEEEASVSEDELLLWLGGMWCGV